MLALLVFALSLFAFPHWLLLVVSGALVLVWLVGEERTGLTEEGDTGPGALYASGLIAAGGIVGLLAIGWKLVEKNYPALEGAIDLGKYVPAVHGSALLGILAFGVLCISLHHFARKPLEPGAGG
jgi:hypothetical protein